MATTQEELDLAFVEVGTAYANLRALMGTLASLSTVEKTNLVLAINEVNAKTSSAGAQINDAGTSSTSVYSSTKTVAEIEARAAALRTELLGGAGPTIDSLKEIADLLVASDLNDDNALAALTTAMGNRVRFDAAQVLDAAQKAQVNANIGSVSLAQFGDPAHSYKNVFLGAINA